MTALLEATGVVKRFGDTVALDGFDLAVAAGEIAGLVGHNGAGKSTFARVTAGLVTPDAGTVRVDGMNASRAADRVRPILGLAPQELALYPTATARENLFAFAGLYGLRRRDARRRIDQLAGALALGDVLDRRVRDLSGGQQRRLQAATAMIHRPRVLLLDEPTVGADPITRDALLAVVRAAADEGAAVVYTTHYLPELDTLDATLAVADHGRVVARGSRAELLATVPGGDDELHPPTLDDLYRHLVSRMSRPSGVRLAAEVRHQSVLIARDPGPLIGYTVMGLLLITATRPLYAVLSQLGMGSGESGIDRAAAGMAVMFSLFALKVGAAQLLNERTWHTWDRLRTSPAGLRRDPGRQVPADPGRDRRPAGAAVRIRRRRLRPAPAGGLVGAGGLRPGLVRPACCSSASGPRPSPAARPSSAPQATSSPCSPPCSAAPSSRSACYRGGCAPSPPRRPATGRSTRIAPPWSATRTARAPAGDARRLRADRRRRRHPHRRPPARPLGALEHPRPVPSAAQG